MGVAEEKAGTRRQLEARAFLPYAARKRGCPKLGNSNCLWGSGSAFLFPLSSPSGWLTLPIPSSCKLHLILHREPLSTFSSLEASLAAGFLVVFASQLHIFASAGGSGLYGKLAGGSRASLSVDCFPHCAPSRCGSLGGFPMFALPCPQPSDRPAPHPAVTSALPPCRNPVTDVVLVFPLRSSPTGMWFQVHARLSVPSPTEIVALYNDKPEIIRGAMYE